jgi:hypothetical protein
MTPTRAWIALLALSAASTAIAVFGQREWGFALAILVLAGSKARLILSSYLGLRAAPRWQRGFDLGLVVVLVGMAGLALAA